MAYFIGEKKDENVLNVRQAVNGVRVSLIQCDDGTYTFRIEASGLKRPEDFLKDYSSYCAYSGITDAYIKAASDEDLKEVEELREANKEADEKKETEGEG